MRTKNLLLSLLVAAGTALPVAGHADNFSFNVTIGAPAQAHFVRVRENGFRRHDGFDRRDGFARSGGAYIPGDFQAWLKYDPIGQKYMSQFENTEGINQWRIQAEAAAAYQAETGRWADARDFNR